MTAGETSQYDCPPLVTNISYALISQWRALGGHIFGGEFMDIAVGMTEPREPINSHQSTTDLRDAAAYLLRVRKAAKSYLGTGAQSEPAWKLMLALYSTSGAPNACHITSAIKRADIPATTGLRWLSKLHRSGFVHVRPDPDDKRATRVQLTSNGLDAMQRTFVAARFITK